MTVFAALVHYQTPELLIACIDSLLDDPQVEVHVWDNASAPERWTVAEQALAGRDRVTLHVSPENIGFGCGVNRLGELVPAQDGDLLWILNPDTVVRPGAVAELVAAHQAGWDVVSPVITFEVGGEEVVWFAGGDIDARQGSVTHRGLYGPVPPDGPPRPTPFTTGAAAMVPVALWRQTGGFRDDLFLYWEDVEWSLRAGEQGLRMAVVPTARVLHAVGASSGDNGPVAKSPRYWYYNARNRILVLNTSGTKRAALLAQVKAPTVVARQVLRAAVRDPHHVASARAALTGVLHGLLGRSGRWDPL
jgi:GT2 family glycosyltransferase